MGDRAEMFTRYDSADYLKSVDDTAAYLEAALGEAADDTALIAHALGWLRVRANLSDLLAVLA